MIYVKRLHCQYIQLFTVVNLCLILSFSIPPQFLYYHLPFSMDERRLINSWDFYIKISLSEFLFNFIPRVGCFSGLLFWPPIWSVLRKQIMIIFTIIIIIKIIIIIMILIMRIIINISKFIRMVTGICFLQKSFFQGPNFCNFFSKRKKITRIQLFTTSFFSMIFPINEAEHLTLTDVERRPRSSFLESFEIFQTATY